MTEFVAFIPTADYWCSQFSKPTFHPFEPLHRLPIGFFAQAHSNHKLARLLSVLAVPMPAGLLLAPRPIKRAAVINSVEPVFSFCSFSLILIGGQKFFKNLRVQFAVSEMRAELALEIVINFLAVEDFDLLNQPVEAQAERGIGNVVGVGQILERTGKQDEPFDEGHVLVLEKIHPMLLVEIAHLIELNCSFVLYN
jgi:hypothetical protein